MSCMRRFDTRCRWSGSCRVSRRQGGVSKSISLSWSAFGMAGSRRSVSTGIMPSCCARSGYFRDRSHLYLGNHSYARTPNAPVLARRVTLDLVKEKSLDEESVRPCAFLESTSPELSAPGESPSTGERRRHESFQQETF